jgi:dCTP deaminase
LRPGDALAQLRLYNGDTRLGDIETKAEMRQNQLLWSRHEKPYDLYEIKISDRDGSLLLTLDVESPIVGWRAKSHAPLIDFAASDVDPEEFFEVIVAKDKVVKFEPHRLHILSTNEYLRVPPHLACEMRPMDERSGEFRAHAAGFIKPRWGWGKGGGKGQPLTLEVYPHRPLFVGQGQPVAKIGFERMMDIPDFEGEGVSYVGQHGPMLARQFKSR